ncbi:cardiotrophin-2-like [Carcharodon carcharias]|uniref:cardiotrophin-2-like n=1 Tax=Carcharodon carcharias TaxID=13397 RepID=UPI001B7E3F18|nr:cardiotrophin-2-like [Carcharodon carcharias]
MYRRMSPTLMNLCVVFLLLTGGQESAPVEAESLLEELCDYVRMLHDKTQGLLDTYLLCQGSPFNGSDFSTEGLWLNGLPRASIPYRAWRNMTDGQRLLENHQAYSIFQEYLQLLLDDQRELSPNQTALLRLLTELHDDLTPLLRRLTAALSVFHQARPSPVEDPLRSLDVPVPFQRRLRGYLILREYRLWLTRSQRSLAVMMSKTPRVQ